MNKDRYHSFGTGITLLELITAVMIVSILVVLSIPLFKGAYSSFQFEKR